jgi:DNA-binding NtrC family response regulator
MTIQATHFEESQPASTTRAPAADAHFFHVDPGDDGVPPPLDVVERAYVARVLVHTAGRRIAAAHLLGISYPTFLKRLRELGLDRPLHTTANRTQSG